MACPSLSLRASVRLPWPRFQSPLTEPSVRISRTGLSSGIMRLAHGRPEPRQRWLSRLSGSPMTFVEDARLPRLATLRSRPAIEPVHALMAPLRSPEVRRPKRSFAYACDASGVAGSNRGDRHCHSRRLFPFSHPSSPEAPFLDRHYPVSSVLRASPPPCRPGLPLAGFRLACAHHRQGFPCCHRPPLPCVPPSLPRRSRPVRTSPSSRPMAAFPVIQAGRPPRCPFRGLLNVHSRCGPHGR